MADNFQSGDIQTQLELSVLLGQRSMIDQFLRGVLAFEQTNGPEGTAAEIEASMPSEIPSPLIHDTLGFIESAGWISAELDQGTPVYQIEPGPVIEGLSGARRMLDAVQKMEEYRDPEEFDLLCTLPDNDPVFTDAHPLDYGLEQITSKLLELCGMADHRIVLFSPFLEEDGLNWLLPGLRTALERGVTIELVSKELSSNDPNALALSSLKELHKQNSAGVLKIYDYYETVDEETGRYPSYTLHSKLMLVDRTVAYIGSANFTENAFTRYFETGAVLRGEKVSNLMEIADTLLQRAAKQVYPPMDTK